MPKEEKKRECEARYVFEKSGTKGGTVSYGRSYLLALKEDGSLMRVVPNI